MTQLNIFSICIVLLILSRMTIEACSHVRVEMPTYDPMEKSKSIVGRTMELGPMFEWNVVVHPRGEKYNVLGTPASLCGDIFVTFPASSLTWTSDDPESSFAYMCDVSVTPDGSPDWFCNITAPNIESEFDSSQKAYLFVPLNASSMW